MRIVQFLEAYVPLTQQHLPLVNPFEASHNTMRVFSMDTFVLIALKFLVIDAWQVNLNGIDGTVNTYDVTDDTDIDDLKWTLAIDRNFDDLTCGSHEWNTEECRNVVLEYLLWAWKGYDMLGNSRTLGDYGVTDGDTIWYCYDCGFQSVIPGADNTVRIPALWLYVVGSVLLVLVTANITILAMRYGCCGKGKAVQYGAVKAYDSSV